MAGFPPTPYVESRGPIRSLAAHSKAPTRAPQKVTDVHVGPGYLEGEAGQKTDRADFRPILTSPLVG